MDSLPQHKINQIMDQPFMGINIFKNYFSKLNKKNSSFDLNQGIFNDGSPEKNFDNLNSEINDNSILDKDPRKNKASMKISMGDAKRLARLKAKKNSNAGIFNDNGDFRIPVNIETEKILNKLNPIKFKDDYETTKKERENLHKIIRQSLYLKEKTNKISTLILSNLKYCIESNQVPLEQKHIINQIKQINDIYESSKKIENLNN